MGRWALPLSLVAMVAWRQGKWCPQRKREVQWVQWGCSGLPSNNAKSAACQGGKLSIIMVVLATLVCSNEMKKEKENFVGITINFNFANRPRSKRLGVGAKDIFFGLFFSFLVLNLN